MNVLNSINNSFKVVGKNLILAQPFILFLLIFSICSGGLSRVKDNLQFTWVFSILLFLLVIAFLAGWFYMTKKTIAFELYENMQPEEKAVKSFGLIKHFLPGVGEYFLPTLLMGVFYVAFLILVMFGSYKLGLAIFNHPTFDLSKFNEVSADAASLQAYISSLPKEEFNNLVAWFLYIPFVGMIFQIVTTWWIPALFYNTKNPIKAFWYGLKFLFKHFGASVLIYMVLGIFNFIVSYVNTVLGGNIIFSLIGLLLFFYYATYYVVLLFLYYGQNGEHSAKSYIDSRDNCDGEKLVGSESSEEN